MPRSGLRRLVDDALVEQVIEGAPGGQRAALAVQGLPRFGRELDQRRGHRRRAPKRLRDGHVSFGQHAGPVHVHLAESGVERVQHL
jgi:hypothetical protein